MNQQALSSFIWSVADLLRGDYKQSEYGRVILPFTVLRRLDCVLADTKEAALTELAEKRKAGLNPAPFLLRITGRGFYNTSKLDMKRLMGDQDHIASNLESYTQGFSGDVRDIFERFDFFIQVGPPAKGRTPLPGHRALREHCPAPQPRGQPPDGARLRGADPALR
jgi:type I restriction enzyme M protein